MPEDPGNEFEACALSSAPLGLLAVVLAVVSVASTVMALDRHFGEYVTLADAQVRPTQRIL